MKGGTILVGASLAVTIVTALIIWPGQSRESTLRVRPVVVATGAATETVKPSVRVMRREGVLLYPVTANLGRIRDGEPFAVE